MAFTMLCAAMTVILFIIGQVSEGYWKWGDERSNVQYTSAVQTGNEWASRNNLVKNRFVFFSDQLFQSIFDQ